LASPASAFAIDHLQDTSDVGRNKVPHRGTSHILVIPSLTGSGEFPAERWLALEEYFNPDGGVGTFRGYWRTTSRGLYDPIPTLVQPVLYPDECPLQGKALSNCRIYLEDSELLFSGAIREALQDLLARVRDEQGVDLAQFDINGIEEGVPDGWLDGVILSSDIFDGLGLPLAALSQEFFLPATPLPYGDEVDDAGTPGSLEVGVGVIAFIPPDTHEFGHNLGFMDLYEGPTITDVMGQPGSGLSAHSRLQIDWGTVVDVTAPGEFTLAPVLDGGEILRFGRAPRYVLLENRSGFLHNQFDEDPSGVYLYSIDEGELPAGELGFLDLQQGALYLPNRPDPRVGNLTCFEECYLNVNLPVGCRRVGSADFDACVMQEPGQRRDVAHAELGSLGFTVELLSRELDGTVTLRIGSGQVADGETATTDEDAGIVDAGAPLSSQETCSCRSGAAAAPAGNLFGLVCLGGLSLLVAVRGGRSRLRGGEHAAP
ncbi:MAG: hypothetical protein ACO3JL_05090, partial [Myxococcota bacterium]